MAPGEGKAAPRQSRQDKTRNYTFSCRNEKAILNFVSLNDWIYFENL